MNKISVVLILSIISLLAVCSGCITKTPSEQETCQKQPCNETRIQPYKKNVCEVPHDAPQTQQVPEPYADARKFSPNLNIKRITYPESWTYKTSEKNNTHQALIKDFAWGIFTIEDAKGKQYTFGSKPGERGDIRLWPSGHDQWDWRKAGTRHNPGIQPDDFKDLIDNTIDILILTRGVQNVLKTDSPKLVSYLEELKKKYPNLEVLSLLTPDAIDMYNTLVGKGKKVVGIFHSTC